MLAGVVAFHVLAVSAIVALALDRMPHAWYEGLVRGLHSTVGIHTPSSRQMRWVLIFWLLTMLIVADGMGLLVLYVF